MQPYTADIAGYDQTQATGPARVRTKLEWAILLSLLAMGILNLYALADTFSPAKAYAGQTKTPTCGAPLA